MTWLDPVNGDPLGDGRYASATDRPASVDALRELVAQRVADGHAIYPQGGRTALDYGGTPRSPGVAVDTRGLGRVIDYPAADMTITVEAGITLGRLQATLAEHRQRLLIDAPIPESATLGGIFATNTTGPRRFGSGRPRDQIIGIGFVTADGVLVNGGGRVVKNVAGYDLPKLLTGSMGTLGILARMTLKVRPIPEATALVWAPYQHADAIASAVERLNTSATRPVALDVLNGPGARLIGRPLGLPVEPWVLVVGFEESAAAVAWQLERLPSELDCAEMVVVEDNEVQSLWSELIEFQAVDAGTISIVANLRPSSTVAFARVLDPSLWAMQVHAGNGIVHAHALGPPEFERLAAAVDRLRALAVDDGGNLILSRCPVDWKHRFQVWGEPRADWAVAERVKNALDPRGVMNPGRFVGTI